MDNTSQAIYNFFTTNGSKILLSLLLFLIGLFVIKLFIRILKKSLEKRNSNTTANTFIISIVKICFYVILIATILQILGFPVTTVVAAFSVVGLAIGLSVQNCLANVASGFIIIFSHPFVIGDYIGFDTVEGTVLETNILQTKIATADNKIAYIPNSKLTENTLTNYSASGTRRVILDISIGYDNNFKTAIKLIEEIIKDEPLILNSNESQAPFVRMWEHGESAIILTVRVWTKTEHYFDLRSNLLENIKETFDNNNISIPYPQLEVSMK